MAALCVHHAAGLVIFLFCNLASCVAGSITARVWRPSMPGFVYPELDSNVSKEFADLLMSKEDFGLAFAGGGLRGAYLTHGIVRSLRNAKVLEKARYMSVSSGSVWLGTTLQYQTQDSLDTFLGETMLPEQCTPEALVAPKAGSYVTRMRWPIRRFPKNMTKPNRRLLQDFSDIAAGLDAAQRFDFESLHGLEKGFINKILHCFEHLCQCVVDKIVPDGSLHEIWILLTSYVMMHPFGLAGHSSRYCHAVDLERARSKLGKHTTLYSTQDVENKLPYLISQSAVNALQTGTDQQKDPLLVFPLENTPMYTGIPTPYKASAHYDGIGDLLVEPIGFNSEALEPLPNTSKGEIRVRPSVNFFNTGALGEWQGVATSYVAAFQIRPAINKVPKCAIAAVEKVLPQARIWSPLSVNKNGVPITQHMPVGDAGVFDDMGHLPLLRRKVRKMVIYDSSAVHDHQFGDEKSNLQEMVYFQAAFGQPGGLVPPNPPGSPNPLSPVDFLKVFEPSEFADVWAKVQELHAAAKPIVIRGNFTVVDNPWFGIVGGWQVEVVWVLELPIAEWRNALPADTRANLPTWFPNVLASEPMNQFELSALSQYGSWLTENVVLKEIQAMLAGERGESAVEAHVENILV